MSTLARGRHPYHDMRAAWIEGSVLDNEPVKGVVIAGLTHDLVAKRSLVTLTWEGVADKRLVLEVPFGCTLSDLPAEAERVLRAFAVALAATPIRQAV